MKSRLNKKENYDPKGIGERSTAQILATFLKQGMIVLIPFGDNQRYDLVVHEDHKFIRIQCKTARFEQGNQAVFVFTSESTNWNTGKCRNYKGQADIFAVWLPQKEQMYILNVDTCPVSQVNIRFTYPENGQRKGIRLAENHVFIPEKPLLSYP